ncbi:50S ribosomal protein L19 [Patescibacteria group bacterium]|nr:50S ribosomal protein L19 [Patescibacteria group bacterium]
MDPILSYNKESEKRTVPEIKSGDTVRVHQRIKEGEKERIQVFEGVVIKVHGGYGINGTFTVRKVTNGIGVEKIYPFHLPTIIKLEVVKRGKVRRSKLYFLRDKQQKEARLKDKRLDKKKMESLVYDEEKIKAVEEEKKKAEEAKEAKKTDTPSEEGKEAPKNEPTEKKEDTEEAAKTEKAEKKDPKESVEKTEEKKDESK